MFIDLETLVQRIPPEASPRTLHEVFFDRVSASVLNTMLMPAKTALAVFDVDISGLGNRTSQSSEKWPNYQLVGAGTDELRFEKKSAAIPAGANLATLRGTAVDPVRYGDDIRAGFRAGVSALRHRKREVMGLIHDEYWAGLPVRQVLRPTAVYGRFLEAATHPAYLSDPQARATLFGKLGYWAGLSEENASWVHGHEVAAMIAGDVPYFTSDFGGSGLTANQAAELPAVYPAALRQQAGSRMARVIGAPTAENEYLIGMSLLTTVTDSWAAADRDTRSSCLAELLEPSDAIAAARRIGDFLYDSALWNAERTECGWITPLLADADNLVLDLPNFTVYEGGGMLLFLAELAAVTGEAKYAKLARAGIPDPARWPALDPAKADVSVFSGAGSPIYLLSRLGRLPGSGKLLAARDEYLSRLGEIDFATAEVTDYVGGLAGLTVLLANLTIDDPDGPASPLLSKVASVLLERAGELPAVHLAHGQLGPLLALSRAGAALGDSGLLGQAEDQLHRLLVAGQLFAADQNWCWGSTGAIQATARILSDLGASTEDARTLLHAPIEAALSAPLRADGDLSLCHGEAGDARALADACRLIGDEDGAHRAHERLMRTLRDVRVHGYRGGLAHSAGLTTFMLGLTGVGHALLAPAGTPSALLLSLQGEPC